MSAHAPLVRPLVRPRVHALGQDEDHAPRLRALSPRSEAAPTRPLSPPAPRTAAESTGRGARDGAASAFAVDGLRDVEELCARLHHLLVRGGTHLDPDERAQLADDVVTRLQADALALAALRARIGLLEQRNAEVRAERTRQTLQIAELSARMAQLEERFAEPPSQD